MLNDNFIKLIFAVFSLVILGCSDNYSNVEFEDSLTVDKAKQWYQENVTGKKELGQLKVNSNDNESFAIKPSLDWNIAEISKDSIWTAVELPWKYENGYEKISDSEVEVYCNNNGIKPIHIEKLIILKNKKTGRIYGFRMLVTPDLESLLYFGDQIKTVKYLGNKDVNFGGSVIFKTINNQFINGFLCKNGTITGILKKNDSNKISASPLQKIINNQFIQYTIEYCYFYRVYSVVVGWSEEYFNGCKTITYTVELPNYNNFQTSCDFIALDDIGGPNSNITTKYFKEAFNKTMSKQLPNACVTSTMVYINKELCGKTVNEGVYWTDYLKKYGELINKTGVSLKNIYSFVSDYFVTDITSSWKEIIDKGGVLMTNVPSDIPNSTHNVLIVGYSSDGSILYMDPELGTMQTGVTSTFIWSYSIGVLGCK